MTTTEDGIGTMATTVGEGAGRDLTCPQCGVSLSVSGVEELDKYLALGWTVVCLPPGIAEYIVGEPATPIKAAEFMARIKALEVERDVSRPPETVSLVEVGDAVQRAVLDDQPCVRCGGKLGGGTAHGPGFCTDRRREAFDPDLSEHIVTCGPTSAHTGVGRGGAEYLARCDCWWVGPWRAKRAQAQQDGIDHRREVLGL